MIGVVGALKISYCVGGKSFEEIVDPQTTEEFSLKNCGEVTFRVEELTYIEDTVYGVVLSLVEPEYREDEYLVGSEPAEFRAGDVFGRISMCY